jgi:hypothetical protein
MTPYVGLDQLMGHFHEDFMEDYGDPWVAVDDFVRGNREFARLIPGEVRFLLQSGASESELSRTVHDVLGSAYLPTADGWTYRGWLEAVADRVEEILRAGQ